MVISPFLFVCLLLPAIPFEDDAVLEEGRKLLEGQHYPAAIELLKEALANGDSDERQVRILLSEARVANGEPEQALEVLAELDWESNHDTALAMGRAQANFASWQSGEDARYAMMDALSYYERAMELATDDDARARVELGFLYLDALGDFTKATALADVGLEQNAKSGELLFLRGAAGTYVYWNAKQSGDGEATERAFEASRDDLIASVELMARDQVGPWVRLQWLHEDKGNATEAVAAAIQIIDRQPDTPFDGLYALARRYAAEQEYAASGAALEKMVSLSAREVTERLRRESPEDFPWVTQYMAWSVDPFMRRNDQATARAILSAIVAADPGQPLIWADFAAICQTTARYEDAIKAYDRLLELDSSDPRTFNDYAAILHYDLNRDLEKAKEMYQTCIDMADKELAMADLPQPRRAHVADAKRIAQNNLNQLAPPQQSSSLLDSMLDGLRNLDLPEEEEEGSEGETSADSEGGDETTGES